MPLVCPAIPTIHRDVSLDATTKNALQKLRTRQETLAPLQTGALDKNDQDRLKDEIALREEVLALKAQINEAYQMAVRTQSDLLVSVTKQVKENLATMGVPPGPSLAVMQTDYGIHQARNELRELRSFQTDHGNWWRSFETTLQVLRGALESRKRGDNYKAKRAQLDAASR